MNIDNLSRIRPHILYSWMLCSSDTNVQHKPGAHLNAWFECCAVASSTLARQQILTVVSRLTLPNRYRSKNYWCRPSDNNIKKIKKIKKHVFRSLWCSVAIFTRCTASVIPHSVWTHFISSHLRLKTVVLLYLIPFRCVFCTGFVLKIVSSLKTHCLHDWILTPKPHAQDVILILQQNFTSAANWTICSVCCCCHVPRLLLLLLRPLAICAHHCTLTRLKTQNIKS